MLELGEVTSTNDFLRSFHPLDERRITLVTAEHQTAGRGSGANHWHSAPGENLLFSLLVHPRHVPPERMFLLSEAIALAVRQAVEDFVMPELPAMAVTIKWPNDIYCGDQKVCGMLIENDLQGQQLENCIMGVGINVNQTTFTSDGSPHFNPVSLAQLLGHEVERRFVLERVVEYFTRQFDLTEQNRGDELHQAYLTHLYRKGQLHRFADAQGEFRGTIADVEPTGHLIITDEMGQNRRYAFKQVEHLPNT